MKKALSVLLAAAVILGLAAPVAFAEPEVAAAAPATFAGPLVPAAATIYLEPDPAAVPAQSSFVDVAIPASHTGCSAACTIYWDVTVTLNKNLVTFRPQRYLLTPGTPIDINNTFGNAETMRLGARQEGTVRVYAECQECKQAWYIDITIVPPADPEVPPDDLLYILKTWWYDLKWTWDYQIHPFFKYVYFNCWNWFVSAWNLLINSITGLFK